MNWKAPAASNDVQKNRFRLIKKIMWLQEVSNFLVICRFAEHRVIQKQTTDFLVKAASTYQTLSTTNLSQERTVKTATIEVSTYSQNAYIYIYICSAGFPQVSAGICCVIHKEFFVRLGLMNDPVYMLFVRV